MDQILTQQPFFTKSYTIMKPPLLRKKVMEVFNRLRARHLSQTFVRIFSGMFNGLINLEADIISKCKT